MERDADGRLTMNKNPGKYRSTAMVRSLRLQRLKETTMSRTAALDVRQAAKLGVTKVPKPKVYGRKKGTFSDITKMLSSGGMGYGQKPKVDDKKGSAGTTTNTTTKVESKVTHDDNDEEQVDAVPKLNEDQRRAALILSVKDRRPANARHFGRKDLQDFQKGFDRKTYMEFKRRMNTKLEELTQKIRAKYERRKKKLDEAGFFHPSANAMRVESAFQNELQKRLSLDEIEGKVLDEMLRESRGEVINKKSSALDSKFDNLLKLNEASQKDNSKGEEGNDKNKLKNSTRKGSKASVSSKQPPKGILKNSTSKNSNNTTNEKNNNAKKEQKSNNDSNSNNDNNDNNNADNEIELPGKEEGPAGALAKEIARQVAGDTEAELRKRTSDRHVKDPFGDEENAEDEALKKEADIWDNEDSDEEVDEKIGDASSVNKQEEEQEDNQELTAENVAATQSQLANRWDDEIKLDDGEGSDVGSELTEDMEQVVEVKAKKKKKVKLDSFQQFKLERRKAVRARNLKRNKALKEGKLNETIDDADFKDLSRHRGAVIQIALGSGKHTIKRTTIRKYETIGERAVKAPLPKYVEKEIRQLGGTIEGGSFDIKKNAGENLEVKEKNQGVQNLKEKEESEESDSEDEYDEEEEEEEEEKDTGGLTQEEEEARLQRKRERARARRKKRKENRKAEEDGEPLIRRILENIWDDLKMPNNLKVEFAIKYSAPERAKELSEALPRWQRATMAVVSRENLLATMRYLDDMRKQNEFVSIRSIFTKKQIDHLTQLDVWIPKEDMFEASALTWVKAMEENLRPVAKELILELYDLHDDKITFRGQKYMKYLKSHMENPALIPGEPLLFSGNPYLRRTGTLLVGR